MPDTTENTTGVQIPAARADIATQAIYQVEGMLKALHAAALADQGDTLPYLVQGMAVRLNELNNVVMTIMRSDECDDSELRGMLAGEFATD